MNEVKEFNLNESLDLLRNHIDNEDVRKILDSFQNEKYADVIHYIQLVKESFQDDADVTFVLFVLELLGYMKLEDQENARMSLKALTAITPDHDSEKLLIVGELACQIDAKIARKILSQLVKLLEEEQQTPLLIGKAYLLLAEIEEGMEKLTRAIKYYQKGMEYFSQDGHRSKWLSFLAFKIGLLYSALGKKTEAIESLKEGLVLADHQGEDKIHILVSLGKILGSLEKDEEAFSYLTQALELIENSRLKNMMIHAETLTEVGFYYFNLGKVNEALPFYEKAIAIYHQEKGIPSRKLGMIYMQYGYCLEHCEKPNNAHAGMQYENGLRYIEESGDQELYENAIMDVIAFFEKINNKKKKRYYETKVLKLINHK